MEPVPAPLPSAPGSRVKCAARAPAFRNPSPKRGVVFQFWPRFVRPNSPTLISSREIPPARRVTLSNQITGDTATSNLRQKVVLTSVKGGHHQSSASPLPIADACCREAAPGGKARPLPGHCVGNRSGNAHYWTPPEQIRTGGFPAYGSYLGCLTAKPTSGHGWRNPGLGSQSAASFSIRCQLVPSCSLRH